MNGLQYNPEIRFRFGKDGIFLIPTKTENKTMKKITDIVFRGRFEDKMFIGTAKVDGVQIIRGYCYGIDVSFDLVKLLKEGSVNIDYIHDDEYADSIAAEFGD